MENYTSLSIERQRPLPAGVPLKTTRGYGEELVLMQFDLPDGALWPFAVLVRDLGSDRIKITATTDWSRISNEDAEVLRLIVAQLTEEAAFRSGEELLLEMEDSFSNAIRLTERVQSLGDATRCFS